MFPTPSTVVSAEVIATEVSQLSVAVAVPVSDASVLASHSTVTLAGDVVNVGAVVSVINTFCVCVVMFPLASA